MIDRPPVPSTLDYTDMENRAMAKSSMRVRILSRTGVLAVLAYAVLASSHSTTNAAPVTLGFEAEVIDVDVLAPADLPFTVENGDVLTGRFTFEPVDADPGGGMTSTDTVQEFTFSVVIDSTVVSTSTYALQVRDNSGADDDPTSFSDHIDLGCASNLLSSCEPGTVTGADSSITWGFILPLTADDSVLDGADISADPNVWNQFTGPFTGFISIGFSEQGGSGVLRINAHIGIFTVVPEPLSQCLLLPLIVAFISTRCPNRRR